MNTPLPMVVIGYQPSQAVPPGTSIGTSFLVSAALRLLGLLRCWRWGGRGVMHLDSGVTLACHCGLACIRRRCWGCSPPSSIRMSLVPSLVAVQTLLSMITMRPAGAGTGKFWFELLLLRIKVRKPVVSGLFLPSAAIVGPSHRISTPQTSAIYPAGILPAPQKQPAQQLSTRTQSAAQRPARHADALRIPQQGGPPARVQCSHRWHPPTVGMSADTRHGWEDHAAGPSRESSAVVAPPHPPDRSCWPASEKPELHTLQAHLP